MLNYIECNCGCKPGSKHGCHSIPPLQGISVDLQFVVICHCCNAFCRSFIPAWADHDNARHVQSDKPCFLKKRDVLHTRCVINMPVVQDRDASTKPSTSAFATSATSTDFPNGELL